MDIKEIYKNKIPYEQWTEADHKAFDEKEANPELIVLCPRCNKELQHFRYNNGTETFCPTIGCLYSCVRGI
ncbi:MAG: hypothetical protein SPL05_05735 [Eubacteriales bacterium]|nr:hypothetical protein [Eubacteriales bacterium]